MKNHAVEIFSRVWAKDSVILGNSNLGSTKEKSSIISLRYF
jgi:hypothetical protein